MQLENNFFSVSTYLFTYLFILEAVNEILSINQI